MQISQVLYIDLSLLSHATYIQSQSVIDWFLSLCRTANSWADPEGGGGQGVRTPTEKSQKYGVFSNTGQDPLKTTKLPSQHSMLGHHRPTSEATFKMGQQRPTSETPFHNRSTSETPFKWRFVGGPMMARL